MLLKSTLAKIANDGIHKRSKSGACKKINSKRKSFSEFIIDNKINETKPNKLHTHNNEREKSNSYVSKRMKYISKVRKTCNTCLSTQFLKGKQNFCIFKWI